MATGMSLASLTLDRSKHRKIIYGGHKLNSLLDAMFASPFAEAGKED